MLWRRLDQPGHESARLVAQGSAWHLHGTAVFVHDQHPCRLDYAIVCNSEWQTLSARVNGWVGNATISLDIAVDAARRWWLNGTEYPAVAGCSDLDLGFSPATNVLPLRRLRLPVGQQADVRSAWLGFPAFTLEPLDQLYRRIGEATYHYESAGGQFATTLQVNAMGFVTHYYLWQEERGS
jgi:hypothetical protein